LYLETLIDKKMKTIKFKTLHVCSNGSSFFVYNTIFKNSTQLLFYKKDYLHLSFAKNRNNNHLKTKSLNDYKKKYLT
jgi:hypothetical protein